MIFTVQTQANISADMQIDQDNLRRKNEELALALREKSRKQMQTQELYDKLKRRDLLGHVQNAASDAVEHTVQASVAANRYVDKIGNQNQRPLPPTFSNRQPVNINHISNHPTGRISAPPIIAGGNREETWAGYSSPGNTQCNPPLNNFITLN